MRSAGGGLAYPKDAVTDTANPTHIPRSKAPTPPPYQGVKGGVTATVCNRGEGTGIGSRSPQYNDLSLRERQGRWNTLGDQSRPICDVIKCARAAGLSLPTLPHDPSNETLPSFHIKCLYNKQCSQYKYHHPYPDRSNRDLMDWAQNIIPDIGGDIWVSK